MYIQNLNEEHKIIHYQNLEISQGKKGENGREDTEDKNRRHNSFWQFIRTSDKLVLELNKDVNKVQLQIMMETVMK